MTIRYINPANDAEFDSTGQSIVTIQVPSGQYWLPRLIKVGLLGFPGQLAVRPFIPRLFTKLYHGTPNDNGPGALIDNTVNTAQGDASAILNNTLLQPGEWLTAVTTSLNSAPGSGDVVWTTGLVYLEVDGLTTADANEAAQLLASSTPGRGFLGNMSYPLAMPPMPDRSLNRVFTNPGSGNAVTLIATGTTPQTRNEGLFIYNVSIEGITSPPVGGADITLGPIPPVSPPGVQVDPFMYYNPYTANAAVDFAQNFHGYQMLPGGVQAVQAGNAAIGAQGYGVVISYRVMPILT